MIEDFEYKENSWKDILDVADKSLPKRRRDKSLPKRRRDQGLPTY